MGRVEVTQKIVVYEIDDVEVNEKTISINSHWNNDNRVVLRVGRHTFTVIGEDLKAAIDNAMNTG